MELSDFFQTHTRVAVAFSGGTDSAYLLYAAMKSGAKVRAYYVSSAFQPRFEREDAELLARQLGADMTVLSADVLSEPELSANTPERCYLCKRLMLGVITERAALDGFDTLLDGTNASDDAADRPGMRALRELSVLSPLRDCGLTKAEIRALSREAGLFTWNKPAYSCLATRIPAGESLSAEGLSRTERAEDFVRALGFENFRVRTSGGAAKIQLPASQLGRALEQRERITGELKQYYSAVLLDMEARNE